MYFSCPGLCQIDKGDRHVRGDKKQWQAGGEGGKDRGAFQKIVTTLNKTRTLRGLCKMMKDNAK